ncbi:MAG: hypothetical protein KDK66_05940 [Deltaproteobacteria bacterium]|nr:hypothetical protein [Deltaproteobacteria bacterium]
MIMIDILITVSLTFGALILGLLIIGEGCDLKRLLIISISSTLLGTIPYAGQILALIVMIVLLHQWTSIESPIILFLFPFLVQTLLFVFNTFVLFAIH